MLQYIIDNLLPLGMAVAGAIVWIFDKRKRDAEIEGMDTQNVKAKADVLSEIKEAYDGFAVEIRQQLANVKGENGKLKESISEILKENEDLRKSIATLEYELNISTLEREKLKAQVSGFIDQAERDAKLIARLQRKIESYEKEIKAFRKERL